MFGFGDDAIGLEVVEPGHLAAGQVDLPLGEFGRRGILGQFLVDLLDIEGRLPDLAFQSLHVELVVAGVDLEEHAASLHELAGAARLALPQQAARHLGGKCHLPERHDHAIGVDLDPPFHLLNRRGSHGNGRGSLGRPAGRWLLNPKRHEAGNGCPEDHQGQHPAKNRAEYVHELADSVLGSVTCRRRR